MHRDLYKSAKAALSDRSLPVRAAAAQCLLNLASNWNALYTTELDSVSQAIFRAFDGANAQARKNLSQLMGTLLAYTQQVPIRTSSYLVSIASSRKLDKFLSLIF